MKTFVAKYSNYLLILRSSRPAVQAIGQPSVPGLSIRFDGDALVRVEDEETIEMILNSNAFKRKDIVLADDEKPEDLYKNRRSPFEPEHNILEMKYGAIVGNVNPKSKIAFTPEQKKIVSDMVAETAKEMAKEMAREMAKEMLKSMAGKVAEEKKQVEDVEDDKEEQKQDNKTVINIIQEETKRRGRPPKNVEDKKEAKTD